MKCTRPECDPPGEIDEGYCNRCGAPALAAVVNETPEYVPTAAPRTPGTSGPRSTTRGSGTQRAATTGSDGLGGRRVEVPPPLIRDAVDAVLTNPSIAESKRFCGNPGCNQPVGRGRDGEPGRTDGFCSKCRHPFSFSPKLAPGTLVGGQYEVEGCIAHGGLGWIYLARDQRVDGRWVVLKGLLNTGDIDVIRSELRFLAQVDHPNIVRVYNFAEHENDPYIVMEYVRGATLRASLEERKSANNGDPDPLPASHAITFMLSVLPAFGYLHQQGLLYCDFKPDNVIRTSDSLKLIDMGAVYRMNDTTSAIYGTPGFQAPEIADTGPTIPSDLYTVGRTLVRAVHAHGGFHSTYAKSLPPMEAVPLFQESDSLYRFLVRATAADPDDRFQSADEMAVQLGGVLREIVAAESGTPWPEVSVLFTGELHGGGDAPDDWRGLPTPLVAADDAASGFLAALAAGVSDPEEILDLLAQAPERTVEVQLREVPRAHRRRALRRRRHRDQRDRARTRGSGAPLGSAALPRSPTATTIALSPSSAACTRRCRASSHPRSRRRRRRSRPATPPAPRTGTTSSRRPIRASPEPSSGWHAAGSRWATSTVRSRRTTGSPGRRARTSTRRWPRPKPCSTGAARR